MINRLGYGLLNKVVLCFPTNFWGDLDSETFGFAGAGLVGEFYMFWNFAPSTGQPTLVALNSGNAAIALEQVPDAQIVEKALAVLRVIFKVRRSGFVAPSLHPLTSRVSSFAGQGGAAADGDGRHALGLGPVLHGLVLVRRRRGLLFRFTRGSTHRCRPPPATSPLAAAALITTRWRSPWLRTRRARRRSSSPASTRAATTRPPCTARAYPATVLIGGARDVVTYPPTLFGPCIDRYLSGLREAARIVDTIPAFRPAMS